MAASADGFEIDVESNKTKSVQSEVAHFGVQIKVFASSFLPIIKQILGLLLEYRNKLLDVVEVESWSHNIFLNP